jgi:hypothetical protein
MYKISNIIKINVEIMKVNPKYSLSRFKITKQNQIKKVAIKYLITKESIIILEKSDISFLLYALRATINEAIVFIKGSEIPIKIELSIIFIYI